MFSILIPLVLFFTLCPPYFGKIFLPILFLLASLASFGFLKASNSNKYSILRLLAFALAAPFVTHLTFVGQAIRAFPLLFLLVFYPYKLLRPRLNLLVSISQFLIYYSFITQLIIGTGNQLFRSFRDIFYPIDSTAFDYQALINLDQVTEFGAFRLGGLWHNPNVLASIVFYLFLILFVSWSQLNFCSALPPATVLNKFFAANTVVSICVLFSLLLSASRTYIAGIALFLFLIYWRYIISSLSKLKFSLSFTLLLAPFPFLIYFVSDRFLNLFSSYSSLTVKGNIFLDFLKEVNLFTFFFGSTDASTVFFDTDIGYFFGLGGITAILSLFLLFFIHTYQSHSISFAVVISVAFVGLGNSNLFGLLTANLAIVLFIVLQSSSTQKRFQATL